MASFAGGVSGVAEGLLGDDHAEELGGVGGFDVVGGDAEFERVEVDGLEERAASGVGHVGGGGVAVEMVGGVPVGVGDVGDGIDAALDVGPEGFGGVGLGEEAAHADDRERDGGELRCIFVGGSQCS